MRSGPFKIFFAEFPAFVGAEARELAEVVPMTAAETLCDCADVRQFGRALHVRVAGKDLFDERRA